MAHTEHPVSERHTTTTTTTNSGGGAGLGFIVGALVIVVGVLAYIMLGGDGPSGTTGTNDVNVTIEGAGDAVQGAGEAVQGAAEAVEGAATQATE